MSEFMPTTESVRDAYTELVAQYNFGSTQKYEAAFDRWLATVRREAKAAAWDEGYAAYWHQGPGPIPTTPNPYREE